MTVPATLSKRLYERFGDQPAYEPVDPADVRGLNELDVSRFNAKAELLSARLESRLTVLESRLEASLRVEIAELRSDICGSIAELQLEMLKWLVTLFATAVLAILVLS